jgi:hypothetical protein
MFFSPGNLTALHCVYMHAGSCVRGKVDACNAVVRNAPCVCACFGGVAGESLPIQSPVVPL